MTETTNCKPVRIITNNRLCFEDVRLEVLVEATTQTFELEGGLERIQRVQKPRYRLVIGQTSREFDLDQILTNETPDNLWLQQNCGTDKALDRPEPWRYIEIFKWLRKVGGYWAFNTECIVKSKKLDLTDAKVYSGKVLTAAIAAEVPDLGMYGGWSADVVRTLDGKYWLATRFPDRANPSLSHARWRKATPEHWNAMIEAAPRSYCTIERFRRAIALAQSWGAAELTNT